MAGDEPQEIGLQLQGASPAWRSTTQIRPCDVASCLQLSGGTCAAMSESLGRAGAVVGVSAQCRAAGAVRRSLTSDPGGPGNPALYFLARPHV